MTTTRNLGAVLAGALLLSWALPARASHYDLASIDLVDGETAIRLSAQKIQTTEDLWKATASPKQATKLAAKVKVPVAKVREWHDFCDLLRLAGVGPKVARVLQLGGVKDLAALAKQEPADLAKRIKGTNAQHEILGKLPDEDTVRTWVEQARKLSVAK